MKEHKNEVKKSQKTAENNGKNLQVGELISKTELFLEKDSKKLVVIVSAIVLILVVFCLYKFWYMPSQEKKAMDDIFYAEQYFNQQDYNKALNGDGKHPGFVSVSEDYSSTKQGKLAHYYMGIIYLEQGKYNEALTNFEKCKSSDEFMPSQRKSLMGDCYMELNNLDKAISCYTDASKIKPNNLTTPAILMKLGTAYEMKKDFKKALECYKKIKTDYPRSMEFSQIEKYISRMESLTK